MPSPFPGMDPFLEGQAVASWPADRDAAKKEAAASLDLTHDYPDWLLLDRRRHSGEPVVVPGTSPDLFLGAYG